MERAGPAGHSRQWLHRESVLSATTCERLSPRARPGFPRACEASQPWACPRRRRPRRHRSSTTGDGPTSSRSDRTTVGRPAAARLAPRRPPPGRAAPPSRTPPAPSTRGVDGPHPGVEAARDSGDQTRCR